MGAVDTSAERPAGEAGQDQKPPTIMLFGDSHSVAIQKALVRREILGLPCPVAAFRRLKFKGSEKIGDITFKDFLGRIRKLGPEDVALSMIGGSHYAVFSTIQHPQPFDFYSKDDDARPDAAEIIPFQALRTFFADSIIDGVDSDELQIRGDGAMLEAVRNATAARVVHILPPPPIRDSAALGVRPEQFFTNRGVESLGISNPELRLKFWSLQARIVRKFCSQRGIDVMTPPIEALEDGFLRPGLHSSGAHANWRYGELLICQIEKLLAKFRSSGSRARSRTE